MIPPLVVAAEPSAGQAGKETRALRISYKVHIIKKAFAVTSDQFHCVWNCGCLSHSFRYKSFLDGIKVVVVL